MFKHYLIAVLFCFCAAVSFAQQAGSSQRNDKTPADAFSPFVKSADSALLLAAQSLQKAIHRKDKLAAANAYNAMAKAYAEKGQLDSAVLFYQQAKNGFSLNKSDELVANTAIALAKIYAMQYKIDAALKQLIEADSLSLILENASLQADVKWNLGIVYKNKEDYTKAADYFRAALHTFQNQNNFNKYIAAGCNLSMAYRLLNKNDSSLYILEKCATIFSSQLQKDSFLYAEIEENTGDTYLQMNQHEQALSHFTVALGFYSRFNRPMDIAYQKYSIGLTYLEINQFQQAESHLLQAYRICDSLKNYKYLLWISKTLASTYVKEKKWFNAYNYLQKAKELEDSINIKNQIIKTNALTEKYESEKKEKADALLKSENQIILWTFISGLLLLLAGALLIWLNRTRKKIKEQKILNYFATSLYNQNTIEDVFWDIAKNCISQLNFEDCVIYVFDESRNMLVQKAAFGPKNPAEHIITNMIEIPLGTGIVGSVALSLQAEIIKDTRTDKRYLVDDESRNAEITVPILVEDKLLGVIDSEHHKAGFFTKRHLAILQKIASICSKKLTRYFVEEGLRKKIARDLHDDMGSTLSSINIISKVALQQHPADGHLKSQLTSIKDYSSDIMESMSDMVWAINPLNDTMESLLIKMKEWAAEICEPKQVSLQFEANGKAELVKLDAAKRKHIYLIFKEAVNNAIKYSNCQTIFVKLLHNKAGKSLELIITDDGEGFDTAHHKTGNGLQNMQSRAHILQGHVEITSAHTKGTSVRLVCQA